MRNKNKNRKLFSLRIIAAFFLRLVFTVFFCLVGLFFHTFIIQKRLLFFRKNSTQKLLISSPNFLFFFLLFLLYFSPLRIGEYIQCVTDIVS